MQQNIVIKPIVTDRLILKALTKEDASAILHTLSDIRKKEEEEARLRAEEEERAKRVTLRQYMEQFRKEAKAGKRLTEKGSLCWISLCRTTSYPKKLS